MQKAGCSVHCCLVSTSQTQTTTTSFLFILFVLSFWIVIISNQTKHKRLKTFLCEKELIVQLTFNPGSALTSFQTSRSRCDLGANLQKSCNDALKAERQLFCTSVFLQLEDEEGYEIKARVVGQRKQWNWLCGIATGGECAESAWERGWQTSPYLYPSTGSTAWLRSKWLQRRLSQYLAPLNSRLSAILILCEPILLLLSNTKTCTIVTES